MGGRAPFRATRHEEMMTEEPAGKSRPPKRTQQVYTLLVQVGRKTGDGLPPKATGAALLCYSTGVTEEEAVRECVAVLKLADLAPLDITGYGTIDERVARGHEIEPEEKALMARALAENAVIVAEARPFFDDDGDDPEPARKSG